MVLSHTESHILEDVNKCIIALGEQDADDLDRAAGAIRGRAARVAHIVSGEMDSYEPGAYTEGVMRNVQYLTNAGMWTFFSGFNVLCIFVEKVQLTFNTQVSPHILGSSIHNSERHFWCAGSPPLRRFDYLQKLFSTRCPETDPPWILRLTVNVPVNILMI